MNTTWSTTTTTTVSNNTSGSTSTTTWVGYYAPRYSTIILNYDNEPTDDKSVTFNGRKIEKI